MSLIKIKDTISPDLARRARAAGDKRPHLLAMGTAVKALGDAAFTDASKRPAMWRLRKDNYPHPLLIGHREKGGGTSSPPMLSNSIRVEPPGADTVRIVSDRPYAAIHQLGGEHIPARPFLPFFKSGQITGLGRKRVEQALKASLRTRGL